MSVVLKLYKFGKTVKSLKLNEGDKITFGRGKDADCTISDNTLSRKHCKISHLGERIVIEDLNSKNGLLLNGIKIRQQSLYIEDELKFGDITLMLDSQELDSKMSMLLTSKNQSRKGGDITLEMDKELLPISKNKKTSFQQLKTMNSKDFVKESKLYSGVSENTQKVKVNERLILIKEKTAFILDLTFSFLLGFFSVYYLQILLPDIYTELFPTESLAKLDIKITVTAVILSMIIFKINRSAKKGSIFERIFKL